MRLGDREVLRRVHLAVRDVGWGTVLPDVRSIDVRQGGDDLAVSSDLGHTAGRVVVDCAVEITGSDQRLAYAMDGVFGADFDYNRIGLCVLLPPVEYAGASFAASGPDGSINGILPVLIGPQRIDGDLILPLFPAFDRLRAQIAPDLAVELDFSGDLFEMEDQPLGLDGIPRSSSTRPRSRSRGRGRRDRANPCGRHSRCALRVPYPDRCQVDDWLIVAMANGPRSNATCPSTVASSTDLARYRSVSRHAMDAVAASSTRQATCPGARPEIVKRTVLVEMLPTISMIRRSTAIPSTALGSTPLVAVSSSRLDGVWARSAST